MDNCNDNIRIVIKFNSLTTDEFSSNSEADTSELLRSVHPHSDAFVQHLLSTTNNEETFLQERHKFLEKKCFFSMSNSPWPVIP